jgi:hypothetical protein
MSVVEEVEGNSKPSKYSEAITSIDCNNWMIAIHDELESHEKNGTWDLLKFPKHKKSICGKYIFKIK